MKKNMERKKRIAMLGHKVVPSRRGGIEMMLTTLCPLLAEKGFDVTCYNRLGDKVEGEYVHQIQDHQYRSVHLKTVPTIQIRGIAAVVYSFLASVHVAFGKYDLIHYHAEGPCAMMWIPKLFGKKCIVTVHGLDWQREKWKKGFGAKYIKLGEIILAHCADEIIVLSENIKKYFFDTYGRTCTLIPNGIEVYETRPAKLISELYGLTRNSFFCSISRLVEEKAIHDLIEAYKMIDTDKKLVIAGESSDTNKYVRRLKEMADGNPNIIFTGFISGELLQEIFSNAYVYVLPSYLEGMPITLLEAMSYGNCTIGSDIPEIMEVVEDKAVIFEKGNVVSLAEKMKMLDNNPDLVKQYKNSASEFITEKYSWDKTLEETLKVYRKFIKDC